MSFVSSRLRFFALERRADPETGGVIQGDARAYA